MEHVSNIIPRALNGHGPASGQPSRPAPRTLNDLAAAFDAEEALENPDVVTPLSSLTATEDGRLEVPKLGIFAPTEWSRAQLATLLGVRFDRWFENASPKDRADELNRRLARATTSVRLRTKRGADGGDILRAIVSPGYSPVSDALVARHLSTALSVAEGEVTVGRMAATDRTTGYVVQLGRPARVPDVGDIWGGIFVRNSGVGYASLVISLYMERLVCKNGLALPVDGGQLVRRRHHGLDEGALTKLLADRFAGLPGKLSEGADLLRRATAIRVSDVEETIRGILHRARLPQKLAPRVLRAHEEVPELTAFAVVQALTAAARDSKPEERFDLEAAAGAYLADQRYARPAA